MTVVLANIIKRNSGRAFSVAGNRRFGIAVGIGVILASLAYPMITFLLGLRVEGYSHLRDHISELGLATLPLNWVLTVVLLVDAALIFALAFAVAAHLGYAKSARSGPWLIGLFGLALFIGGVFPCDENCRPTSVAGLIHVLNIFPSIIATIGAPFAMRKTFALNTRLSVYGTMAFINGLLTIFFIIISMTVFPALDLEGLGQRLVLVLQLSFYILVATAVVHVALSANTFKTMSAVAALGGNTG